MATSVGAPFPVTALPNAHPRQNRLPDDLYHHGVQRERMAQFLDALKARCTVHEVNGGRDWRLGIGAGEEGAEAEAPPLPQVKNWYGVEERAQFEQAVEQATGGQRGGQSHSSPSAAG